MVDVEPVSLVAQFAQRAAETPTAVALSVYPRGARTERTSITWQQWHDASRAAAVQMIRAGVAIGDRVVVMSANAPMWPVMDMALQMIGAIGVGVYPASTAKQVATLFDNSGATMAFVRGDTYWRTAVAARALWSRPLPLVFDVDEDGGHGVTDGDAPWATWIGAGYDALAADAALGAQLDARVRDVTLDHTAALIYTSGSTGEPKGACISHRYLAASAASISAVLQLSSRDRALSYLPFSHAAERVFGQGTRIANGMPGALIEDPADLFSVAADFEPTLFGGLPRLFERLYEASEVARRSGGDPHAAITDRIGTRCRIATSGGAAMPEKIARALAAVGITVIGAYGQTEHLCVAMNRPDDNRFDTVGPPMPGTTVRIADDGELLVAPGALTFSGYWNNPEATAAAFSDDGAWLHTGDRAEILADGALRITGRIKELIALSTGRKIAPLPLESALTASPYIAHAVCYGEGKKFLTAVLSLRHEVVEAWARSNGFNVPWPELARHSAVRALIDAVVCEANAAFARSDRVQRFVITADAFTVERGDLSPTLKVVRSIVTARYAAKLNALYTEDA